MAKPPVEPIYRDVETYIEGLFAPEDEALAGVAATLDAAGMPQISVAPVEGKLLGILAMAVRAERILEIGMLGGYSTIWLARALAPGGRVVSIELKEEYADVARRNLAAAGVHDRVEIRVGRALDVLPEMHDELMSGTLQPFDFVFIDADKPPYLEYFGWALKLTRKGSIIVADNVIRSGAVLEPSNDNELVRGVQRFNSAVAEDERVTTVVLQTVGSKGHDGMAISLVR
jgi:caffeoyl-CoA O-methyltransferase